MHFRFILIPLNGNYYFKSVLDVDMGYEYCLLGGI